MNQKSLVLLFILGSLTWSGVAGAGRCRYPDPKNLTGNWIELPNSTYQNCFSKDPKAKYYLTSNSSEYLTNTPNDNAFLEGYDGKLGADSPVFSAILEGYRAIPKENFEVDKQQTVTMAEEKAKTKVNYFKHNCDGVWVGYECKTLKSKDEVAKEALESLNHDKAKEDHLFKVKETAKENYSNAEKMRKDKNAFFKEQKNKYYEENKNNPDAWYGRDTWNANVKTNQGLKKKVDDLDRQIKEKEALVSSCDSDSMCMPQEDETYQQTVQADLDKLKEDKVKAVDNYNADLKKNFAGSDKHVRTFAEDRKASRAADKAEKAATKDHEKELARAAKAESIMEKNDGDFDGRYGTLHGGITKAASGMAVQALGVLEEVGRGRVMDSGTQQAATLASKGPSISAKDQIDSQNSLNETARQQLDKAKRNAKYTAIFQGALGLAHIGTNRIVKGRADDANYKLYKKKSEAITARDATTDEYVKAEWQRKIDVYDEQLGNVQRNLDGARNKQLMNSLEMGVQMAQSIGKAVQFQKQKEFIKDQTYTGIQQNQNYNIQLNNEAAPQGSGEAAPVIAALDSGQVLNTESDEKAVALEDRQQFNPNDNTFLPNAPQGEGLTPTAQQAPQAAGGSAGGVGGTSAAQDDGSPQAPPKTKDVVGSYASSDGAVAPRGGASKSSGGAEGVGIDQAFADLLKKLLPGDEEEKKDAGAEQVALGDRAPASDQAAVIGRNQNIFEVIHKRYLKKNQEGAILYNL